jgi:hypothetical protein
MSQSIEIQLENKIDRLEPDPIFDEEIQDVHILNEETKTIEIRPEYVFEDENKTLYIISQKRIARPFFNGCLYIGTENSFKQYDCIVGGGFHSSLWYNFDNKACFSIGREGFGNDAYFRTPNENSINLKRLSDREFKKITVPYPDETKWIDLLKKFVEDYESTKDEVINDDEVSEKSKIRQLKDLDEMISHTNEIINNENYCDKQSQKQNNDHIKNLIESLLIDS